MELLDQQFGIGRGHTREIICDTLQQGTFSAILPIEQKCREDICFGVWLLLEKFATETLYSKTCSLRGNVTEKPFGHKCGLFAVYPISKVDNTCISQSLYSFISDFGVPEKSIL